jgi:hypothetical protein
MALTLTHISRQKSVNYFKICMTVTVVVLNVPMKFEENRSRTASEFGG